MPIWSKIETEFTDLQDTRLEDRLSMLLEGLSKNPCESIPGNCNAYKESIAAYRFFSNRKVTFEKVLNSHKEKTLERIKGQKTVLCIQDTTELDYTNKKAADELGHLNYPAQKGLVLHPTIAVSNDGVCLGIVDAQLWSRKPASIGKRNRRHALPIEDKESFRWIRGYRAIAAAAQKNPSTTFISVGDRESDLYEIFHESRQTPGVELLIRAAYDRKIQGRDETIRHLWESVGKSACKGLFDLSIEQTDTRRGRKAQMEVRSTQVHLCPPARGEHCHDAPVPINAVHAKERNCPADEEPIEWLLLTTLPVESFESAERVIEQYRLRWTVEIFFRILKQGCRIEQKQLGTDARLRNCIAVYLIIAWRILFLLLLGRKCPSLSADAVFTKEELIALYAVRKHSKLESIPPLNEAIVMVASFGGYFGRTNDRHPGPKHIWVGLSKLADYVVSYNAFKELGMTYV